MLVVYVSNVMFEKEKNIVFGSVSQKHLLLVPKRFYTVHYAPLTLKLNSPYTY